VPSGFTVVEKYVDVETAKQTGIGDVHKIISLSDWGRPGDCEDKRVFDNPVPVLGSGCSLKR